MAVVAWREVAEADKGSGTAVRGWATAVVDTGDRVCVGGSITGARFLAVRDGRYKPREKENKAELGGVGSTLKILVRSQWHSVCTVDPE